MTLRFFFVFLALSLLAGGTGVSRAQLLGTATLTWTAPGDDGQLGTANLYDLRYSLEPINEENFPFATRVTMLRPKHAGSPETYTVQGLMPGYDYYFAVRTTDDAGNWSKVSNLALRPARNIKLESIPQPFSLSMPWPNPARNQTRVMLTMPHPGEALVEVYDAQGRYVQTLANGFRSAGPFPTDWRLDNYRSQPVSAGVYLIRAKFADRVILRRVAVVR
jgi:hypothetical protein